MQSDEPEMVLKSCIIPLGFIKIRLVAAQWLWLLQSKRTGHCQKYTIIQNLIKLCGSYRYATFGLTNDDLIIIL